MSLNAFEECVTLEQHNNMHKSKGARVNAFAMCHAKLLEKKKKKKKKGAMNELLSEE